MAILSSNLRKQQFQSLVSIYEKQNVITQSVDDSRNVKNVLGEYVNFAFQYFCFPLPIDEVQL